MNHSTIRRWSSPEVILVATNLLEGPSLMLHAIYQAKLSGARIILVHVTRPCALRGNCDPRHPSVLPSYEPLTVRAMDQMVRSVEREGILCESVELRGAPAEQISLLVKSRGVDRVIVATRSLHGVERLLMGSVAEELAAILEVPVCIVGRCACSGPPICTTPPRRILVANSSHWGSSLCTSFASAFAETYQADLTLLHVLDSGKIGEAQREEARQKLATYIPMQGNEVLQTSVEVREGDPATEILDVGNSLPHDFIILGSPPQSAVSRILASSVIHRVVAEAKCPVITIKPTDLAERDVMYDSFHAEPALFHKEVLAEIPLGNYANRRPM